MKKKKKEKGTLLAEIKSKHQAHLVYKFQIIFVSKNITI